MILYIHPKTNMSLKQIIPMSLPALVNRLQERWEVLGRFHDEWTPDELRRASLVMMDIHWFLSIAPALELSRRIKSVNPGVKIVAGGSSASIFAKQILRDSSIDYIIRGDAEIPLVKLAEAVLEGNPDNPDIGDLPNLIARDFESKNWYSLNEEDLNANNYRDISWFPALQRGTERLHRWTNGRVYPVHPFLMIFRGCPTHCKCCLGGIKQQRCVFRRGYTLRAAEKVRDDLIAFSDNPKQRFVNVPHDLFLFPPPSYAETILDRPYDLDVYLELAGTPTQRQIELLTQSFRGGDIRIPLGRLHASSPILCNVDDLIARVRQIKASKRFEVRVSYVGAFLHSNPVYAEAYRRVVRETRVPMDRMDFWWYDFEANPNEQGYASEEEYQAARRSTDPYRLYNFLFRGSVLTYRFFPKLTLGLLKTFTRTNAWAPVRGLEPKRDEVTKT